jgi:hypothetical protein
MIYEQEGFMIINLTRVRNAIKQLEEDRIEQLQSEEYDNVMQELGIGVIK